MRRLDAAQPDFDDAFRAFLDERRGASADVDAAVADIIEQVRNEGLAALLRLAKRFDGVELDERTIRVTPQEIEAGASKCSPDVVAALELAAGRIRAYHQRQTPADQSFVDDMGVELGWRWTALDSVGVYVPGGVTMAIRPTPATAAGTAFISRLDG